MTEFLPFSFSMNFFVFFKNFGLLMNQRTLGLTCTILQCCNALHCTDRWQVISWRVTPPSTPSLPLTYFLIPSLKQNKTKNWPSPPQTKKSFWDHQEFFVVVVIGASFCIGRESQCLPYAGLFIRISKILGLAFLFVCLLYHPFKWQIQLNCYLFFHCF